MWVNVFVLCLLGLFKQSYVVGDCGCAEHGSAGSGPGFSSPQAAIKNSRREKILYVPCISLSPTKPDYLSVVDADPFSPTYSTVISRLCFPVHKVKDELHHFGWNTLVYQH